MAVWMCYVLGYLAIGLLIGLLIEVLATSGLLDLELEINPYLARLEFVILWPVIVVGVIKGILEGPAGPTPGGV